MPETTPSSAESGRGLGTLCPCGHLAVYHPSARQQEIQLQASKGRYPGECKGGASIHCRCITSREEVQRTTVTTPGALRLGSCCINVGTDGCVCENPTNYGLDTRVTPHGEVSK